MSIISKLRYSMLIIVVASSLMLYTKYIVAQTLDETASRNIANLINSQ